MSLTKRIRSSITGRYKQWTFRPYVIQRQVAGEKIQFLVGDLFGEGWYSPNHNLSLEYEWIKAKGICPGDVVVDCGANHGFSTTLFAKWAGPMGLVYAFEPYQHNVEILQRNLELNNVNNVRVRSVAVGAENATAPLGIHPNAAILKNPKVGQLIEEVHLRRIDDEIDERRIDFI
jgi:FkbM family methyltransferase